MATLSFFRALLPYLGGKRELAPLIFALIAEALPRAKWNESTLLDPMCGGGAASLYGKAQGFQVVASDLAERAVLTARALVANSNVRLDRADVADLFRPPEESYSRIASSYVPDVFTDAQADWLDRALAQARLRDEPVRSLLLLVVVKVALRVQPMSLLSGTDASAAASGDFDRVSPRRLGHYLRAGRSLTPEAVWRIACDVNRGVFGGSGAARQGEAGEIIANTEPDVLYLDPPYPGTSRYEREYAVLDELLQESTAASASPPTLDQLLAAADHIPLVVVSFGGPQVAEAELVALVEQHRPVLRSVVVPYRHLGSLATEEKNRVNREYIVVAGRG